MNYTPYANLSDDELLLDVCNDEAATAREIELMLRVERLLEENQDLGQDSR